MSAAKVQERKAWVAIVAAFVLLAQALFGAPAIGAAADPLRFADAGVICSTHGGHEQVDPARPAPPHLPDCCVTGCLAFAAAALPTADAPRITPPRRLGPVGLVAMVEAIPAPRRSAPGNPRAPPPSA